METVAEQYETIVKHAAQALREDRPNDALGWLNTEITVPEGWSMSRGETTPGLIHRKIIEVMRAVGAVAKAGLYNEAGTRYNFRQADDVFNALHDALAAAGVYPKPMVQEITREWGTTKGGTPRMQISLKITYRFTAEDGSFEDVHLEVDNWNTSDKGIGAAMTVALRIALLQLFVIKTDDVDPDAIREEATSGGPPLSTPLRDYLLHAIHRWPADRLEEAWNLLTAHVAGSTPIHGTDSPRVWWEPFAERYIGEVDACTSKEALSELWKRIGPFGLAFLTGGGVSVKDRIMKRNEVLLREHRAAMEECRDTILAADDRASLDHAREVVRVHLTNHRITSADSLTFAEMLATKTDQVKAAENEAARAAVEDEDPAGNYDGEPADG